MELISRKDAKARGLTYYYTGKQYKCGHDEPRRVNGGCPSCSTERAMKWAKDNSEKSLAYNKAWRDRNPDKMVALHDANHKRLRGYPEPTRPYPVNGLCEGCGEPEVIKSKSGKLKRLSLDHCHESGEFRGWLCYACNLTLGLMKNSSKKIRSLAEYNDRFLERGK